MRFLLSLLLSMYSFAEAIPQQPAAEKPPPPATVRGRVTDAGTGRPIRMARVVLAPLQRGASSRERVSRTAADGTYEFRGVPSGRFTMTASKARYVTLQYGQKLPAPSGIVLDVAPGRALERIDVALARAAAIAGRITDELGDPLERASVAAMRIGYSERGRELVTVSSAITNDAGEYRISQLQPGEYYVVASERAESFGSEPDADIGFLKTAYPANADIAGARRVPIRDGQDAIRIDITMLPARAADISGRVITADGLGAANVMLVLQSVDSGPGSGLGSDTRSGSDGSFLLPRVISGRYELHARLNATPNEGASLPLVANGEDVTGWTVPLTAGGRIRGKVVPPEHAAPASPGDLRIVATSIGETLVFGTGFGGPVKDDWTFDWDFLLGSRIIRPLSLPAGWYRKAVMRGETDITDTPIVFTGAEVVSDVEIVLTTETTSVAGAAVGAGGAAAMDYTVVAFADESSKWTPRSRFIKAARPDDTGRFRIEGLPPGRYRIAAVDKVENFQWLDREFLQRLRPDATSLTLQLGQSATVNLKVVQR
jgi:protocatechuate 3,4-dioxygenase beta subunit